jgi:hypothetical protein
LAQRKPLYDRRRFYAHARDIYVFALLGNVQGDRTTVTICHDDYTSLRLRWVLKGAAIPAAFAPNMSVCHADVWEADAAEFYIAPLPIGAAFDTVNYTEVDVGAYPPPLNNNNRNIVLVHIITVDSVADFCASFAIHVHVHLRLHDHIQKLKKPRRRRSFLMVLELFPSCNNLCFLCHQARVLVECGLGTCTTQLGTIQTARATKSCPIVRDQVLW